MKKFSLIIMIAFLLYGCSSAMIEPTPTATVTITEKPTITPTLLATVFPTITPSKTACPKVGGADASWERYKPNSFENLLTEISQISSPEQNPGISFYIETSGEHQFPSCITMEYSGKFREIPSERKFMIEAWSGIFGPERAPKILEILKHEVLLIENGRDYWFIVQEPLIPYMENELAKDKPAIMFMIWAGSSYLSEETDHVFIIGEFAKP